MSTDATIKIKAKDETAKAFNSAQGGLKKVGDFAESARAQIAGLVGAAGFGALIQVNLDAAASTKKMSDALGMNVEDLSAWQYAVRGTKVDAEKMGDIFKDVSEKIGDAYANGAGEALEVMERLNLDTAQMVAMAPDQQLLAIAGALDQVGTHAEKVQIMESLGSDLSLLLPILDDNAAGFREMRIEAEDLNAIITNESAAAAEQYKDDLEKLKASTSGLAMELGTKALPALTEITGAMVQAAKDAGVLEALWVGLGGAASMLIYGTEQEAALSAAQSDIDGLEVRAKNIQNLIKNANDWDAFLWGEGKSAEEHQADLDAVNAKLDMAKKHLASLNEQTIAAPPQLDQPTVGNPAGPSADDQKQQEELEKLRNKQQAEYAVMIEGFAGEMELTYIHEAEKKDFLDLSLANEAITHQQHETALTLIAQEGTEARKKLAAVESTSRMQVYEGMMGNLTALMASGSKTQFETGKKAAIAQAAVKGGQSVVDAYQAGMSTGGPWAPALAVAYATTAAAATATQIQSIKSQQFSGGGTISPMGGGGVSAGGGQEPVAPVPPALGGAEPTSSSNSSPVTIQLVGSENTTFSYEQVDQMFDAMADAVNNGDKVFIEKNSRQAQELTA